MAQAAEEARAKYKKQQNGFSQDEDTTSNVYEHYTHHRSPYSNIVYDNWISDEAVNEIDPAVIAPLE